MKAAIATPHRLATQVGQELLDQGASAVDAAIAAAAVLTVVFPHNCALGGDLAAVHRSSDGRTQAVLGVGGYGSRLDASSLTGSLRTGVLPLRGPAAVTVPGLVSGWQTLHRIGGTREWRSLLQPAVELAREGVPVSRSLAASLQVERALVLADGGMREVFAPNGNPLTEGQVLRQPALSRSLAALAADPRALYEGELASLLAGFLADQGSAVTSRDLAGFVAETRQPLAFQLTGARVWTTPPPTPGVTLAAILGAADLVGQEVDLLGADLDVLARIAAQLDLLRERRLTDPDYLPADGLEPWLADTALREFADRATRRELSSRPWPVGSDSTYRGDTIALVAHDQHGDSVSLIQSLRDAFGSGLLDPRTGILLQNRGGRMSRDPSQPNHVAAGKRPAHTLTPAIVRPSGDGPSETWVVGTMGGLGQPLIVAQLILRLRGGASPSDAVSAPRIAIGPAAAGTPPWCILAEADLPPAALAAIADSGVDAAVVPARSEQVGHAQVVVARGDDVTAGSDPRADG